MCPTWDYTSLLSLNDNGNDSNNDTNNNDNDLGEPGQMEWAQHETKLLYLGDNDSNNDDNDNALGESGQMEWALPEISFLWLYRHYLRLD